MSETVKAKKQVRGVVISDKMNATIVVKATYKMRHPVYNKVLERVKKYYAHDPKNECHLGDRVLIEECRPLSKTKRWRLVERISTVS